MIFSNNSKHSLNFNEQFKKIIIISIVVIISAIWFFLMFIEADSFLDILNKTLAYLVFLFCLIKGTKEFDLFNPYYLFLITPLSLMLYSESVSPFYLVTLTQQTWNIAISNLIMFVLGLNLIKCQRKQDLKNTHNKTKATSNIKNLTLHTYFLLILGLMPTFVAIYAGFPSLIRGDLQTLKTYANIMPLSSVFTLFKFPAVVSAIKTNRKQVISITIILCLLAIIVNFNKFEIGIFMFTVILSVYRYSVSSKIKVVRLMFYAFIVSIIMLWAFDFYDSLRGFDTADYLIQTGRISNSLSKELILPYLYLTTPWTNLQFVIENSNNYTFGLWFFKPFINYLGLDNLFHEQYILISRTTFNTFTYITVLFKDFGSFGSVILSFFMGIYVKNIYKMYKRNNSPFITSVYALNAFAVFMMFFSNHWFGLSYPISIIIIMVLYNILFVRYKIKKTEF